LKTELTVLTDLHPGGPETAVKYRSFRRFLYEAIRQNQWF